MSAFEAVAKVLGFALLVIGSAGWLCAIGLALWKTEGLDEWKQPRTEAKVLPFHRRR